MRSISSNKDFNALATGDKPFVIDFYADWCGPCQTLLPTVTKLAAEYEDKVEIVKVNIDDQRELANHFQVRSIPTLFFMKNNEIVDKVLGLTTEHILRQKVDNLL